MHYYIMLPAGEKVMCTFLTTDVKKSIEVVPKAWIKKQKRKIVNVLHTMGP